MRHRQCSAVLSERVVGGLRILEVLENGPFEDESLYQISFDITTHLLNTHLRAGAAILLGSIMVEYLEPDLEELGWRLGSDYFRVPVTVWQSLWSGPGAMGWFLPSCPYNFPEEALEEAIRSDAICLLSHYRGSRNLSEIVADLSGEWTELPLAEKLISFCDSIVLPDNDGNNMRIITAAV